MTIHELLAEGRLSDAIALQRSNLDSAVHDQAARLMYFELLVIAGRFLDANATLREFEVGVPEFRDYVYSLRQLLKAERRRQHGQKPALLAAPPIHVSCRWHAVKAMQLSNEWKALKWADRAEQRMPEVRGHVNGREFVGLRDADDRFAGQFEFLTNGRYHWVAFEQVKKLTLGEVQGILDSVLRPAELVLKSTPFASRDGDRSLPIAEQANSISFRGHIPLVYPGTSLSGKEESFLLGHDADFKEVAGLVVGIGERVMTFGEEEMPLGEVKQIEFRNR